MAEEFSTNQGSALKWIVLNVLAFLGGALVLGFLSTLQKIQLGAPLVFYGFGIPLVAGGVIGLLIYRQSHKLHDFERHIEKRTFAEEALLEKERFQQALLDDMQTFVAVLEPDGSVIFVNNTPLKLGGFQLEDVIGQKFYDAPWWTHSDEVHALLQKDIELCSQGESLVHDVEIQIADGSLMWIEYSMHPIYDDQGNVQYLVPEGRDINDRKKLEEQFRQAQKMEAVGQLAGGIAHDFNNLLQVINSRSSLALRQLDEGEPSHENVKNVLKAGEKAAILVKQILAFSRRQVLDMKNVDLNDVIVDVMKMLRRLIGEHVTLQIQTGHDLEIVLADAGQIEQILMNLCVNSRDAMPDGGTITITTENFQIDDDFCQNQTWAEEGSYVRLRITDTGSGMDEETLGNIFEPFFTTKIVGKGTGLGLSMVYGLVKQHQGLINIQSEVGESTTVEIYLPTVVNPTIVKPLDTEVHPVRGGAETILLAEDNLDVQLVAQEVLKEAGYRVLTASNGEEALQIFNDHEEEINLALLDVIMPRLGGRAVYEKIHSLSPSLPFIFASGYSMDAIHTNFILDEDLVLIPKPYQHNDLLKAIRQALDGPKTASAEPKETGVRILLVDDDDDVRMVLKNILEGEGHEITEAANGRTASLLYQKEAIDLVITDLVMPEKEGLELIRDLKLDDPHVKIIAISGGGRGSSSQYLGLARNFGAAITLEKPISNKDLLDSIRELTAT